MALKSKELCRRTRERDGAVTFHVVDGAGKLQEVSAKLFREYECSAYRTDTMYSTTKRGYRRDYKTIYL